MNITREDLGWAATQGIVTPRQSDALWDALETRTRGRQKFDGSHVAYYFGALIVVSAMAWFLTDAWDGLAGIGISAIAMLYAIAFTITGEAVWKRGLRVPGGLLFTLAVWMTPLVVYGIEKQLGYWPQGDPGTMRDYHVWVRGSWLVMELATVLAGAAALRARHFPFLSFPIAFALWYMSMDLTPLLMNNPDFTWEQRAWVSAGFGALLLIGAYIIDMQGRQEDYAFWWYLFGLMAFWGGLTGTDSRSEVGKFLYLLINLGLISLSLFLRRRIFIVFGAMGVFLYLGHLAW
ncbi:MAG TPA: DUF2157 domain-containing protein, partial [Thermoanaerobaculia bacterium]|nr:DUF2157 domain-containing protein [Thermoanaerobaculia bacterium]